jgi:hypothetical protein
MIEEHIKFHEEPTTYVTHYNNNSVISWHSKSAEQKAAWVALISTEYLKAMTLYKAGDHVSLKTNAACVVEIVRFETDPEKVISYQGLPCVIKGIIKTWQNPNELAYSIPELDWTTLVPVQAPILEGSNDDC